MLYGGGEEAVPFEVDDRTLRHVLAGAGAVVDLTIDDDAATPVASLWGPTRHAVDGHTVHVDLLRVRLDVAIQATVPIELVGEEASPGVKGGGILEHVTRELTVEALPNDIPDKIEHDVSAMEIGDTLSLDGLTASTTVQFLDDPETLIATLSPPRLQSEEDEGIEQETSSLATGAVRKSPPPTATTSSAR